MTVRDFLELYDKESAVWVYDDATEKCLYDSEEDNYVDEKVLQIAIQGIEEGVSGGVCIKVNTKNLPEYNTRKFLENFRNEFNNQIRPCITEATLKNWMKRNFMRFVSNDKSWVYGRTGMRRYRTLKTEIIEERWYANDDA